MSYMNGIGSAQTYRESLDVVSPTNAGRLSNVAANSAGVNPVKPTGTTSVSATAGLLAGAFSGSDVRLDRVSSLQQVIAAGTYNVPAAMVASRMMSALTN